MYARFFDNLVRSDSIRIMLNETNQHEEFRDITPIIINGDEYVIPFVRGKPCGRGIVRYLNGDTFQGVIENWKKISGTLRLSNGLLYEGEFVDNVPVGKGSIMYDKSIRNDH